MYNRQYMIPIVGILAVGVAACTTAPSERLVQGSCATVFDGEVCTWGKMLGDEVTAFGATVPLSTAENAAVGGEMVFPPPTLARIPLPAEITERTGINHLGMNWETQGHPPGTFLTPHFDFHFYTMSGDEVEAIDCSDLSKPEVVPAGYVLPDLEIPGMGTLVGLCVPHMGMHALVETELNATELFGATMIVGYYAGNLIHVEPMIARDKLLNRESFSLDVPVLAGGGEAVSWPAGFEAVYDEAGQAYQFVFSMAAAG